MENRRLRTTGELAKEMLEKFGPDVPVYGESETDTWEILPEELALSEYGGKNVLILGYKHG